MRRFRCDLSSCSLLRSPEPAPLFSPASVDPIHRHTLALFLTLRTSAAHVAAGSSRPTVRSPHSQALHSASRSVNLFLPLLLQPPPPSLLELSPIPTSFLSRPCRSPLSFPTEGRNSPKYQTRPRPTSRTLPSPSPPRRARLCPTNRPNRPPSRSSPRPRSTLQSSTRSPVSARNSSSTTSCWRTTRPTWREGPSWETEGSLTTFRLERVPPTFRVRHTTQAASLCRPYLG